MSSRPSSSWISALLFVLPLSVQAQASVLTGLISDATDVNVFWRRVGTRSGAGMRPADGGGASGLGFELSYSIPGALITRTRRGVSPKVSDKDSTSCRARARANVVPTPCADTIWSIAERDVTRRDTVIKQTIKEVRKFDPNERLTDTIGTVELAFGFSQAGHFMARSATDSVRVSIRETPSTSIYITVLPDLPVSPYFGVRTGLLTLQGGRWYHGTATKFSGDTFQLGGVVGLVAEAYNVNFFVEGSYMRRAFDSPEWDAEPPIGLRSISFTGPEIAFGAQLHFRDHSGK